MGDPWASTVNRPWSNYLYQRETRGWPMGDPWTTVGWARDDPWVIHG